MKDKKDNSSRGTLEQMQLKGLGRVFRIKRQDLNLKLMDLEAKAGVTSLTISKLEKGQLSNCSLETLNKIAKALGLKIALVVS